MRKFLLPAIAIAGLLVLPARGRQSGSAAAHTYTLEPTPKTVVRDDYSARVAPVLRVKSGAIVRVHTLVSASPAALAHAGVPAAKIEPALRAVFKQKETRGPGTILLDGPIYVAGAAPGNVLEVRILKIRPAIPYAYNEFPATKDVQAGDLLGPRPKLIPLDTRAGTGELAPGLRIRLRPFFGSLGVAPPAFMGSVSARSSAFSDGTLDASELVAGSTLYLPIQTRGALFFVGNGHAGPGSGEIGASAMQTSLVGTFQLIVRKDMRLLWPLAKTPTHFVSVGFSHGVNEAAKMSVQDMVDFLETEEHLPPAQAYVLASVAGNFRADRVGDGNVGVNISIPRVALVARGKGRR